MRVVVVVWSGHLMPLNGGAAKGKCLFETFLFTMWASTLLTFVFEGALSFCALTIVIVKLITGLFNFLFCFTLKGLVLFSKYAHSQSLILKFHYLCDPMSNTLDCPVSTYESSHHSIRWPSKTHERLCCA